jgi:hypothetical protein
MDSIVQGRSVLDIPLFHKTCDLYKLLYRYQLRIPKNQRYTLWQQSENETLVLLKTIMQVGYSKPQERKELLHAVSSQVDLLKVFIRLSKDLMIIDLKQYLELEKILQEIGRMVGGWLKVV